MAGPCSILACFTLFLVLVAPSCKIFAEAQTCEIMRDAGVCNASIDYYVFLPPNMTQSEYVALVSTQGLNFIELLPGFCARMAMTVVCSQAYRACSTIGLPLPLCPELCTQTNAICSSIPTFVPFNCSADDIITSGPLWASTSYIGPPESCKVANASVPPINDFCPYPFIWNPNVDSCAMKCPPTGLDDEYEQNAVYVTVWVLVILSLVGCLVHIPPMALQYRAGSSGYALWWFVCQLIGNLGILMGRWLGWRRFICVDQWTLRTSDNTVCGLSAVLNYNGYLGSTLWIIFIMYRILTGITRGRFSIFGPTGYIKFIPEHVALHIIAWIPHGALTIVLLSKTWYNSSSGYTCEVDPSRKWVFYGMLIIPLTVYSALAFVLFGVVLFFVVRNGMNAIVSQWRLFALSGYYTTIVIIVISISYYGQEKTDEVVVAVGEYIQCLLTAQPTCKLRSPVPWGLSYSSVFLVVSVAFFMSLLFLTKSTFTAWKYMIGKTTGLYSVSDWRSTEIPSTQLSGTHSGSTHSGL